jgi:hypothetical protein
MLRPREREGEKKIIANTCMLSISRKYFISLPLSIGPPSLTPPINSNFSFSRREEGEGEEKYISPVELSLFFFSTKNLNFLLGSVNFAFCSHISIRCPVFKFVFVLEDRGNCNC